MPVISSSVPADLSGSSVLSQRDASDIYKMIPETAFPETDVVRMQANESAGTWTFDHYNENNILIFTVQITNATGSNYEWTIASESFLFTEDEFNFLLENDTDFLVLES